MDSSDLARMRQEYESKPLLKEDLLDDPISQFGVWFNQAVEAGLKEPNAMTLATVDANGKPSARIVLLKELEKDGFVFYTNYESKKAKDMASNAQVALVFVWYELHRQVRIQGEVIKVPAAQSDAYFNKRPIKSRLGAIVSAQSATLSDRTDLRSRLADLEKEVEKGLEVKRPEHWGGYKIIPQSLEFWQGQRNRLHDRIQYLRQADAWQLSRLSP